MAQDTLYQKIPKVDRLLDDAAVAQMIDLYGRDIVLQAIHQQLDKLREDIGKGLDAAAFDEAVQMLPEMIELTAASFCTPNMTRTINATGVILHTNLGRAPLSSKHMQQVMAIASGYSNLEYDLESACRGERYAHFEDLLCRVTGGEAAMAVNNNAAAVLLVLSALASGGEVIVSRGELIEIGGKFRIPDVMSQSGTKLMEIGTTNKTHPEDYLNALTENTKMILKVHTSNYQIIGFTEAVSGPKIAEMTKAYGVPFVEDLGSGVLIDLEKYGLPHEPTVQEVLAQGADLVCFSGDKLLGGPQAGLIVGKKELIGQIKKHPLTRALRIDKMTAAALEVVLMEYLSEEKAVQNIPVLQMLTKPVEALKKEAQSFVRQLRRAKLPAECKVCACQSQVGGGSMPMQTLESAGVAIKPQLISAQEFERRLRGLPVPVVARISEDAVVFDMRTMQNMQSIVTSQLKELGVLEEKCVYVKDCQVKK